MVSINGTVSVCYEAKHQNSYQSKCFHHFLHISSIHVNCRNHFNVSIGVGGPRHFVEQSSSWSTRIKENRVMVGGSENVLICEEEGEEEDILIRKTEQELDVLSDEQKLPPWGNVKNEDSNGLELIGENPTFATERLGSTLEPKLHFLDERDEEILSKRMLVLSRCNKVRSALELYMSMEASGLHPTAHSANSLLSCLLRNGFLGDALKVFEKLKKEMTSSHTYSLMLKAIASTQGCDSAINMFMEFEKDGALVNVFDTVTYNTMISICGKANNWVQAERMWKALKEDSHRATSVTYHLLVSTFVRCGQSELAFDAYSEMVQNGLKPGEDMMQAIICACTKEGKWHLAHSVFQSMLKIGLVPNSVVYNALINSIGKSGEVELAFKIFDLMRSSGIAPDAYTWNALLGALNRGSRHMDALRLFGTIKQNKSLQLNSHIYNTALLSCQRLHLWDRSLQILWQMEATGMLISTESYNLVIGACEAAKKPKVALQVYEQMAHKKCIPDTFTYLSLIRACIWGSLWFEVNEILDHVPPDVSLYNAVIHGMCLKGEISSAKKMYMKMCDSGLKPDGKTRALMIQNMSRKPFRQKSRYALQSRCH